MPKSVLSIYIEGWIEDKGQTFWRWGKGKEIKKEEAKKRGVKLCRSSYKEENGRVLVRNAGYDDDEEMRRMVIWWWWGMCSMCIWSLAFHTHVISQVMPKNFFGWWGSLEILRQIFTSFSNAIHILRVLYYAIILTCYIIFYIYVHNHYHFLL